MKVSIVIRCLCLCQFLFENESVECLRVTETKLNQLEGLLYPIETSSRERKSLTGVWNFLTSDSVDHDIGFRQKWYSRPLSQFGNIIPMPVPSSYNDITEDAAIRDFVGWVWYDFEFLISQDWKSNSRRIVLYFGSVHYTAVVWLNGEYVTNHSIGHLPFQKEVTSFLTFNKPNRVTVAINNTLTDKTVPQGFTTYKNDSSRYPPGYFEMTHNFEFVNYAGIHRNVFLYTTPKTYIDDINITTNIGADGTTGIIHYEVRYQTSSKESPVCYVEIYDRNNTMVYQIKGLRGIIYIDKAKLWWPYLMNSDPGYLYTAKIQLTASGEVDVYEQLVGIRTVTWTASDFLINNKSFYFQGFGKHEDYDIRGRGFDWAIVIKDFNLIKWLGANSFRTSHYPYADEIMFRADVEGIVVIDESPACSLNSFANELLQNHKQAMAELIRRDKNHPSVVMWSIGNEPVSSDETADPYFKNITEYVRTLDSTRPLTVTLDVDLKADLIAQYLDIISVNRYYGWYQDTGHLEVITQQMITEYTEWHKKFNKPVLTTEYGADSVAGLHMLPPYVYTEDYQAALMIENFNAFDALRTKGFFIGEMIWNFADFMTQQEFTRPTGCLKGIFTRQRNPKMAAHLLRVRYLSLSNRNSTKSRHRRLYSCFNLQNDDHYSDSLQQTFELEP